MGDKIADLPAESDVPPVPLKTYQWEDIRRQKLEGRYPWTHLYKRPFDNEDWEKSKEHEYEPVIPMDTRKTPPPFVKITTEKESTPGGESESNEVAQDKHHLCVPDKNEYEDSDDEDNDDEDESEGDDASIEITAEELQNRIEERYFLNTPSSSRHDYELPETRSLSPTSNGERSRSRSDTSSSLQDRMQLQADKIKQKFKNFKEQIAKDKSECTPRMKRKNDTNDTARKPKPAKKNKFNFRRHNVKPDPSKFNLPTTSNFHMPQAPRLSLPRLPSFSRSRSSSVKERERKRSQSSETDSKKKFDFHFGTYPRIFNKKKKSENETEKSSPQCKPKSEPSSPTHRRSPFPQRWISRFTEHHKKDETPKQEEKKKVKTETVVKETIFISLHEDPKTATKETDSKKTTPKNEPETRPDPAPSKMEIDNEKFIFISLHEERFPEKLVQKDKEEEAHQQEQEELKIEKEIKVDTVRKFHSMLRQLQTDRKLRSKRRTNMAADDKPQPVEIIEITGDDNEDQTKEEVENSVEAPEDEESVKFAAEDVPPENYSFENKIEEPDHRNTEKFYKPSPREKPSKQVTSIPTAPPEHHIHIETAPQTAADGTTTAQIAADDTAPAKPPAPQKLPRKKLKKLGSDKESKESLSAFEDSVFTDAVQLDEQQTMTKTYIKASLEQIPVRDESVEPEHTTRRFKEYEKALQNSRSFSSVEIENNFYSRQNSLAGLETPVPPARPSRMYSLARKKKPEPSRGEENKENYYDLDANSNYNTFPIVKPDRPRRKFRKRRTYSNSTANTDIKSMDEMEDEAISKNIVNSKQLSVSFLPLTSNVVGEPITDYNIRETSSMIHLNLSDPPLPPKRKKGRHHGGCSSSKFNSLPNQRYSSKTSLTPSEVYNNSELNVEAEIEYADDVNSTIADSDSPPKRPCRRRNTSLIDEDRTSREVESLPSERSAKDDIAFYDSDSKDGNGYAVIGASESRRESKAESQTSQSTTRRKSRRISDFFTLPRIRVPTNYIPPSSQTLDHRRLPSPSRPPRRSRSNREPVYTNENNTADSHSEINFGEEEQLNFNLATEEDDDDDVQEQDDSKNLQANDILEKMKGRPLPPPPRPLRKPKDDHKADYSQCNKKKPNTNENNLNQNVEEKIMNTSEIQGTLRSNWFSQDTRTVTQEFERITREEHHENFAENGFSHRSRLSIERNEMSASPDNEKIKTDVRQRSPFTNPDTRETKNEPTNECSNSNTRSEPSNEISRHTFSYPNVFTQTSQSTEMYPTENRDETKEPALTIITACKLNVSELNVGRLNISEIESSKLVTSTIESSIMQVSDAPSVTDHIAFNSIDCSECLSSPEQCQILDTAELKEPIPCPDETESTGAQSVRSRLSSMIPEVGSDDESGSTVTKAVRPNRRKQSAKREEVSIPETPIENSRPSLAELMCQILQICHSSVGQAIHSLLEQVIPEDREKRNEVQAAIWVITIIVAGCLMLGLQTNEKVVHHHHWDFHFPPPH